jgi:hypothetical protein
MEIGLHRTLLDEDSKMTSTMNRSLLERVLQGLPGPPAVWAVVLGLVPLTAALLPDAYVATVGEGPLSKRVVAGVVFAYAVALSVVAVIYFHRRIAEVEESLVGVSATHGNAVPFRGLENVIGPLLLAAIFVIATTIRTAILADLSTALIWLPISVVSNFPLMSAFWIYVVLLLGLGRLGRRKLSLAAFPQDPSLGLASVGRLAYTAFWIYTAASVPILFVNAGDPTRLSMSLAFFLVGLVIFFVSLWGLHTQLVHARREQIDHARRMLAGVYEPTRSGSLEALERYSQAILAANVIQEQALSIQRWPFDDGRFKRIAAAIGTIVTFTATGIVSRLIYERAIL